jgi:hypothetical protein
MPIGTRPRSRAGKLVCVMWVIALMALSLFGYGWLNVVTPRTTLAWQVRSTARHGEGDPRGSVGRSFQRWLRINPEAPPDRSALRRVRIIGIVEIVAALAIAAVAYLAMS